MSNIQSPLVLDSHESRELLSAFAQESSSYDEELKELVSEKDPNGVGQHDTGSKLDFGKPDVGLLLESFPHALMEVARVATFGAAKYTRGGWKDVKDGLIRYSAAEMRHKLYRYQGEVKDSDSGFLHRAHEAWNSLAQLEYVLSGRETQ